MMAQEVLKILGVLSCIALVVWCICYYLVSHDIVAERIYSAVLIVPMLCFVIYSSVKNYNVWK